MAESNRLRYDSGSDSSIGRMIHTVVRWRSPCSITLVQLLLLHLCTVVLPNVLVFTLPTYFVMTASAYQYHSYNTNTGNTLSQCYHSTVIAPPGTIPPLVQRKHPYTLMANTDASNEASASLSSSSASPQDEILMYVLGVNLARQLGDIRPLSVSSVENDTSKQQQYAKELSQVTAGIVDTLIGRVNEQQQVVLLQQHGNALIQERA